MAQKSTIFQLEMQLLQTQNNKCTVHLHLQGKQQRKRESERENWQQHITNVPPMVLWLMKQLQNALPVNNVYA